MTETKELDYNVLASGSNGNAVRIENIMIDCGIPFKSMKEDLYKCKYLFITHSHSDHLNISTFKKIRKSFPRIKILGNYQVNQKLDIYGYNVDIVTTENEIEFDDITLYPFEVLHNVLTQGVTIKVKDIDVIYVTDSAGNKTWRKGKYDYLFLESNHDDIKLKEVCNNSKHGHFQFNNSKRHTSTSESKAFYYMNRRSEKSAWIELHKSERFY